MDTASMRRFQRQVKVMNRPDYDELPLGFAMSLVNNPRAVQNYARFSDEERAGYTARAHAADSKREMQKLVAEIAAIDIN